MYKIVYVKGSSDVRAELITALSDAQYEVEIVQSIDEVPPKDPTLSLCIVDASAGESEASTRIVELGATTALHVLPLIFISYQATKRSTAIKRQFVKFVPIDVPFRVPTVVEQIAKILNNAALTEKVQAAPGASSLDPTKLGTSYGGELFAGSKSNKNFNDDLLVPQGPDREKLMKSLNELSQKHKWLGSHARRVTFVSSAVANSLKYTSKQDEEIRKASLLLNWGLKDGSVIYATHDIFLKLESAPQIMEEIVNGFKRSAEHARNNLNDPRSAEIIEAICELVLGRTPAVDNNTLFSAQCVLVTELASRASWGLGTWDPHGAHRTLRKLKDGSPIPIDASIKNTFSRMLSEAVSSKPSLTNYMPPADPSGTINQESQDAVNEAATLFGESEQIDVELKDLQPKMKLTKPVFSIDGKLILNSNIELTEDLISLLWQLAAIRPIRTPITILSTSAKK
jgi:hypothetical protein